MGPQNGNLKECHFDNFSTAQGRRSLWGRKVILFAQSALCHTCTFLGSWVGTDPSQPLYDRTPGHDLGKQNTCPSAQRAALRNRTRSDFREQASGPRHPHPERNETTEKIQEIMLNKKGPPFKGLI